MIVYFKFDKLISLLFPQIVNNYLAIYKLQGKLFIDKVFEEILTSKDHKLTLFTFIGKIKIFELTKQYD